MPFFLIFFFFSITHQSTILLILIFFIFFIFLFFYFFWCLFFWIEASVVGGSPFALFIFCCCLPIFFCFCFCFAKKNPKKNPQAGSLSAPGFLLRASRASRASRAREREREHRESESDKQRATTTTTTQTAPHSHLTVVAVPLLRLLLGCCCLAAFVLIQFCFSLSVALVSHFVSSSHTPHRRRRGARANNGQAGWAMCFRCGLSFLVAAFATFGTGRCHGSEALTSFAGLSLSELGSNSSSLSSNCGAASLQTTGSLAVFGGTQAVFSFDTQSGAVRSRTLAGSSVCPTSRCDVNGVVVVGNIAYVAPWVATYPGFAEAGVIAALDASTLQTKSVIRTDEKQGTVMGMVADKNNKFAYVLVAPTTSSGAQVIKLDLIGFEVVGSIAAGADMLLSAAIAENTLLAGTASGNVIAIDLDSFTTLAMEGCSSGQISSAFAYNSSVYLGTYEDGTWCEFQLGERGLLTVDSSGQKQLPAPRVFSAAQGRSTGLLTFGIPDSAVVAFSAANPPGLWDMKAGTMTTELPSDPSPPFGNIMSTCVVAHPSKSLVFFGNPNNDNKFTVWTFGYSSNDDERIR